MKLYDILQDFKGSQDGCKAEQFKAGTQAMLSDYMAPHVVPQGWARLAEAQTDDADAVVAPVLDNKAVVTDGGHKPGKKFRTK